MTQILTNLRENSKTIVVDLSIPLSSVDIISEEA